jgi:chaperonin GroEL
VLKYLDKEKIKVEGGMLRNVATISSNNDEALGEVISRAFEEVGEKGVVLMEESETEHTYSEVVDGAQFDSGLTSPHLITDKDKSISVLENPYVLIVASKIPTVRKIQSVLEHVIKANRSLLVVASLEHQPSSALLMNKVKGNLKVNIVDPPGFGPTKRDTLEDLALLTGATVINEELGDDLDLISVDALGVAEKSVTDAKTTTLTIVPNGEVIQERIKDVEVKIKNEKNPFLVTKLEQRLSMLAGKVGIVRVGGKSKVELKEKKDRVEDAIYATKAALKEGIVPGGGIALLNASQRITSKGIGEEVLLKAIQAPYYMILENAGMGDFEKPKIKGRGYDVVTGKQHTMVQHGIIDPVLVTKTALENAVSVATTILSANCVISNMRTN